MTYFNCHQVHKRFPLCDCCLYKHEQQFACLFLLKKKNAHYLTKRRIFLNSINVLTYLLKVVLGYIRQQLCFDISKTASTA